MPTDTQSKAYASDMSSYDAIEASPIVPLSLWSYDTWGNEEDGWEVNDRHCLDRDLFGGERYLIPCISREAERFLLCLINASPEVRIDWTCSGDGTYELVDSRNGKPLGQIVEG